MPRTLDPILKDAMDNGYGEPIFRVQLHNGLTSAINETTTKTLTPYKYRINNLEMEVEIDVKQYSAILSQPVAIRIGRGKNVDGIDYFSNSAWYSLKTIRRDRTFIKLTCDIFPHNIATIVNGDDNVETVLQNAINETNDYIGKPHINSFALPSTSEWWHSIQFLPDGKQLITNSAQNLAALLKQKYLAYLFVKDDNSLSAISKNYKFENENVINITSEKFLEVSIDAPANIYKKFIWRDENETIHSIGSNSLKIHNFGFIPSTATPQIDGYQTGAKIVIPANIELTPEDFLFVDENRNIDEGVLGTFTPGYCEIEEILDPKHKYTWYTIIKSIEWITNSEGGTIPSTIERVSNYTPLNTSTFNNNLSPEVNNLQALANAVDDLNPKIDASAFNNNLDNTANSLQALANAVDDLDYQPANGWIPVTETWTYASASTINIPSDGTTKYKRYMKIRLKQGGGYKYYICAALTSTLITVAVNTDYTVANAAITDISYSLIDNPFGFPVAFNFSPTWTNVTVGNGTQNAVYAVIGNQINGNINLTWAATSPTSSITGQIKVTLPLACKTELKNYTTIGAAALVDYATALYMGATILYNGYMEVRAINATTTYAVWAATSGIVPFTFGANDSLTIEFRYLLE